MRQRDQVLCVLILPVHILVFIADGFLNLPVRSQGRFLDHFPRTRLRARIVNGDFIGNSAQFGPCQALDDMEFVGPRVAVGVEP